MADLRGSDVIDEAIDPARTAIVSPVRPPPRAARPPLELTFTVELWDVAMLGGAEATRADEVVVNGRYVLRVIVTPEQGARAALPGYGRYGLYGETLEFSAWCEPALAIQAEAADGSLGGPRITFPRSLLVGGDERSFEFVFEVPSHFARQLALRLVCGTEPRTKTVVELKLEVRGGQNLASMAQLPGFGVAIESNVPERLAFLYVSALQTNELRVVAADASSPPIDVRIKLSKELSLGKRLKRVLRSPDKAKTVREAQLLLSDILQFSRDQLELQAWMTRMLSNGIHAPPLLVIHDPTAPEVPWELFELGQSYLGTRAEVVRWTEVRRDGRPVLLSLQAAKLTGSAAMFLGARDRLETSAEQSELRALAAHELSSMHEALCWLNDAGSAVEAQASAPKALLYIASHGERDDDGYNLADAGLEFKEALAELLASERSLIVFVNACESALLKEEADGRFHGLAERLLGRVALGYIGTRADVTNNHAAAIGVEVLRELKAPGATIPSVLFKLRCRAAKAFSRTSLQEEQWLGFLHAFSYVYFGEPLANVQISTALGHAAGEPSVD